MVVLNLLFTLAVAPFIPVTIAAPSQQPLSALRTNKVNPLKRLSITFPSPTPLSHDLALADPLPDLAAISPFYIPNQQPTPLPASCSLTRVSLLIRHSSIRGNDDEFEQSMGPFFEKIRGMDKEKFPSAGSGEWGWLEGWESPIVEDRLEELSETGRRDAKVSYI